MPDGRTTQERLAGARILVVGGSSGVGRAFGLCAAQAGARVAFAARRADKLSEAAAEAGAGAIAVQGDVRNEADCRRMVAESVGALGGLDLVLYTAARITLARFDAVDSALWRELFETNAVGAFLVAGAALPHLGATGVFAYVSTIGVDNPYPGRGAYIASKAALDGGFRALRVENPDARITRILLDPTSGTEAGSTDDKALAYELMTDWVRLGRVPDRMLSAQQVAGGIADALAAALAYPGSLAEVQLASRWRPVPVDVDRQAVIAKLQQVRQG